MVKLGFKFSLRGGQWEAVVRSGAITILEHFLQADQACAYEVGLLLLLLLLFAVFKCFFFARACDSVTFWQYKTKGMSAFLNVHGVGIPECGINTEVPPKTKSNKKKSNKGAPS